MERERHISAEGIDIIADPADFEKNIVVEVLEEGFVPADHLVTGQQDVEAQLALLVLALESFLATFCL